MRPRIFFVSTLLILTVLNARAQTVAISDSIKILSDAGEAQSTVVPPNKKSQCQQGRILISNDQRHPPDSVVFGNNLDQQGGPIIHSKFDMGLINGHFEKELTKTKYLLSGTSDHDLVTLSNGDVLYITGAFSSMPVWPPVTHTKAPGWFADTFRCTEQEDRTCLPNKAFGPGARSVLLVFRSTDCGETFTCVSEMDPARELGGSCAFPQFRRDWETKATPQIFMKPWDMGGSDGQLVKVDPANDRVYVTFQCVGYNPDESRKPEFVPNNADPLNKTLVGMFDAGLTWSSFGFIDVKEWRFNVIPLGGDELGFGYGNAVLFGKKNAAGKYEFDSAGQAAPVGSYSWASEGDFAANPGVPVASIHANVWASPVLTRTSSATTFMLAFPDRFGAKGFGYRFYFLDRTATEKQLVEKDAILPAVAGKDNFVFQVTAIDPGAGPVLLYWYDVDSAARTVTIRGRLVSGKAEYSADFVISQQSGSPRSFALTAQDYWFGDYKTAGGYVSSSNVTQGEGSFKFSLKTSTFHYYPVWIDPNGSVNYTEVDYTIDKMLLKPSAKAKQLPLVTTPDAAWKKWGPPIPLSRIRQPVRAPESEVERDMGQVPRATNKVSPVTKPRQ